MEPGGEEEADSDLLEALLHNFRGRVNLDTESFEDICAPAAAGDRPVSMFRHRKPGRRDDKSSRRGDVEGVAPVPARPASVHDDSRAGVDPGRLLPHDPGRPGHLLHRFSLHPQGGHEGGDLGGCRFPLHHLRHDGHHLRLPQVLPADGLGNPFPDHALHPLFLSSILRKFLIIRFPPGVRIDSG